MKKILITGASKGLGYELAKRFTEKGDKVIGLSRTKTDLNIDHISVDLNKKDDLEKAMENIKKNHSDFDTIILCAGDGEVEEFGEINNKSIENTMSLNLNSNIIISDRMLKNIKKNSADVIIIGASIGYKANKFMPVYSISKWGLRGLIENLRENLKGTKSRIINVVLGGLNTNSNVGKEGRERLISKKTGKKVGSLIEPSNVASLIDTFLSLPKNTEISKIVINRK